VRQVSGGLHGVGASVVNALSDWLEVRVVRDGKVHEMAFAKGKTMKPMSVSNAPRGVKTGTLVRFKPDASIFKESTQVWAHPPLSHSPIVITERSFACVVFLAVRIGSHHSAA
jgi:DNA gyrase/topoisomerase IV subunit B